MVKIDFNYNKSRKKNCVHFFSNSRPDEILKDNLSTESSKLSWDPCSNKKPTIKLSEYENHLRSN